MRVELENGDLCRIDFIKERKYKSKRSEKPITLCVIYINDTRYGVAMSTQNPLDKYNKLTGKKLAFERTLENCTYTFTKEDRKRIWAEFWKQFGHLRGK
jgi:hypothetical protein